MFKTPSLALNVTSTYTVTLEISNGVGLRRLLSTEVATSSTGYAGLVEVLVNYARTENASEELTDPERLPTSEDFVCLLDTDVISIVFSAPHIDQYIDTNR